jgi:hypothetical protein
MIHLMQVNAGFLIMRSAAGAGVALHQLPPHIAAQITVTAPPCWREDNATKFCWETDDLTQLRQAVLDHGGQAKPPWSWGGVDFCECTDPEGNVLQIFQVNA